MNAIFYLVDNSVVDNSEVVYCLYKTKGIVNNRHWLLLEISYVAMPMWVKDYMVNGKGIIAS